MSYFYGMNLVMLNAYKQNIKKRDCKESKLQTAVLKWLGLQHRAVMEVTFSIPNSGKRTDSYGNKLKREGMKAGVPDVFIAYPSGGFPGLFIEFKSETGRLSPEQANMIGLLRNRGYRVEVISSIDDAIRLIKGYLNAN